MPKEKSKAFREVFARLLDMPVDSEAASEISGIFSRLSAGMKNDEAIAMAQIFKAMRGDTAAAKYISEMADGGEAEATNEIKITVRVTGDGNPAEGDC